MKLRNSRTLIDLKKLEERWKTLIDLAAYINVNSLKAFRHRAQMSVSCRFYVSSISDILSQQKYYIYNISTIFS